MRCLIGTLFLASCTMFGPPPTDEQPAEPSVPVTEIPAPVIQQETPEKKRAASKQKAVAPAPNTTPPNAPVPEIADCANLDAGDLKETIKAKLDCITEKTPDPPRK